MLYLMTSPSAYQKLQAEIDNAISSNQISSPITDAESKKLPYLQAVIKEGLRIYPPVTGLMFKTVPKGGDTFNGVHIPEGTDIGYCAWGVHHSKETFGEDADMFRPERWLEAEGEKLRVMNTTVELVFNYGKWQCPGKSVAAIELNKIFVEVRSFFLHDLFFFEGMTDRSLASKEVQLHARQPNRSLEDLQRRHFHPIEPVRPVYTTRAVLRTTSDLIRLIYYE
jgi:cytochrome P450